MENKHHQLLPALTEESEEHRLRKLAKTNGNTYPWDVPYFAVELGFTEAVISGLLNCGNFFSYLVFLERKS